MKEEKKDRSLKVLIGLFIVCIVYTLLIMFVDKGPIGPGRTEVGFQTINKFFNDLIGYNEFFYTLTKYMGYMAFLICAFYGVIGIKQLIERKNLLKVDKKILLLGAFYVIVLILYVLFDKIAINYRPFMLENELEPSYPSSHTMLALCVCLSSLLINKDYIKNKKILKIVNIVIIVFMFVLVLGRILSGVHWITDIIGGILISLFLVYLYYYSTKMIK